MVQDDHTAKKPRISKTEVAERRAIVGSTQHLSEDPTMAPEQTRRRDVEVCHHP